RRSRTRLEIIERAELAEQVEAVADATGVGRREEREVLDRPEAQRCHLQDDRSQVRAQDLGIGVLGPPLVVLLGVQADGDAVAGATGAPRALVPRGLEDRLPREGCPLR